MIKEQERLEELRLKGVKWQHWGPYLAERQWGTVREDYSANGDAWGYFPFAQSHMRAYRWGEDGLAGICDWQQRICFALALWNGRDPILKERLFGLTNSEGNHGEDVKEYYYYLDATPTVSYAKCLYKYPQNAFPYEELIATNHARSREVPEFELMDTGIFQQNRYFDVFVEYAKAAPEDILIRINAFNRGPEAATLHLLPTLWCRNMWSWGRGNPKPQITLRQAAQGAAPAILNVRHPFSGNFWLLAGGAAELLFTENETNQQRLFGVANASPFVKDAFHHRVIQGDQSAVNPAHTGTKAAAHFTVELPAGGRFECRLRLMNQAMVPRPEKSSLTGEFDSVFAQRIKEADDFYAQRACKHRETSDDVKHIQRQAFAGLIWNRQSYHYNVEQWLEGDPGQPVPPPQRWHGRNHRWKNMNCADVISMPDAWEYPWFASWDLAFHCVAMAAIDAEFAKDQLVLLLREWYMNPNGHIPAFEWAFSNSNPPVFAWAALRVYRIERRVFGRADREFLEKVFHKLLINFTWWVNRQDADDRNIFEGGFLGMDNVGIFDRSEPLPGGAHIEQSDATSWMANYCLTMLMISLELAMQDHAYEDVASKFFEHFVHISDTMADIGGNGQGLWDNDDGFYYDYLRLANGERRPLKIRSAVGLIPLFAVDTLEPEMLAALPDFASRFHWFLDHYPGVKNRVDQSQKTDKGTRYLLSIATRGQLERVLRYALSESEFLSPYGVRSLSKIHKEHPFTLSRDGQVYSVDYEPAEATTGMLGGNSNWRGPVWFPMNYLLIEALQRYDYYYRAQLQVEFPTGSGKKMSLWDVAAEISRMLVRLFASIDGRRAAFGDAEMFQSDPNWKDYLLFYEYFNGDNGKGLGASHQTGWTALVAKLIEQNGE
jgi:hypothetical protein